MVPIASFQKSERGICDGFQKMFETKILKKQKDCQNLLKSGTTRN